MMLAALSYARWRNVRQANAAKNLLITVASLGCIAVFSAGGAVSWTEVFIVMCGAMIGGYAGGIVSQLVNETAVRRTVVSVGLVLSAYYGAKAMLPRG